jgi:hypothetical protein
MSMSIELMLLVIIGGLTLLGYMVAINAHGTARLSLSYLIATIMLGVTVWVVVEYVNSGVAEQRKSEIQRLAKEKEMAEQRLREEQEAGKGDKERQAMADKLRAVIAKASPIASRMTAMDLQDRSVDFDGLVGRAVALGREVDDVRKEFEGLTGPQSVFPEATVTLKEAMQVLKEAAQYCRLFYQSDDSDQEELRARIMRQKARSASDLFQKATGQIGP